MGKLQQMASFVAVVDAGSFVAAAEAHVLSRAAVSRHVAALEQRPGTRLLQRTTRRQSLTGSASTRSTRPASTCR